MVSIIFCPKLLILARFGRRNVVWNLANNNIDSEGRINCKSGESEPFSSSKRWTRWRWRIDASYEPFIFFLLVHQIVSEGARPSRSTSLSWWVFYPRFPVTAVIINIIVVVASHPRLCFIQISHFHGTLRMRMTAMNNATKSSSSIRCITLIMGIVAIIIYLLLHLQLNQGRRIQ